VLDAGGQIKAFSRIDGAWLGSIDVAMKAKTSVLFEMETQVVWNVCNPDAQAHGPDLTNGHLVSLREASHSKARMAVSVIAAAHTWPQVTALRAKAQEQDLSTLHVEKLDLLDHYDVRNANRSDIDVLVNNAGVAEGGPIAGRHHRASQTLRRVFAENRDPLHALRPHRGRVVDA
jgi:hypothetical protein